MMASSSVNNRTTPSEDRRLQKDELEALSAIYGEEVVVEELDLNSDLWRLSVHLKSEPDTELVLNISLPFNYPTQAPPIYEINCPPLSAAQKRMLNARLQNVCLENIGESVLYQWVEAARTFLEESPAEFTADFDCSDDALDESGIDLNGETEFLAAEEVLEVSVPEIFSGAPFTDRKSTFQSHLATVTNKSQVPLVLAVLKSNNKVARATHNIYAYRIFEDLDNGRAPIKHQDCEDDGEIGAGPKLLHLLDILNASNVLVIVTRWYGGIHLGPDRFRHINNVARELLVEHGFGAQPAGKTKAGAGKQRGKKGAKQKTSKH